MKHTPGPWTIGPTPHYLRMGQEGVPLTIRSPHHTEEIATVWTCCLPTEANARLIAAAPLMLEALELIRSHGLIEKDGYETVVTKMGEAIAKATI